MVQDGLRGFIVALACLEHFGASLNVWYLNHFDASRIFNFWQNPQEVPLYSFHSRFLGHRLPVDGLMESICLILVPWITHLFIALSGYNLGRKSRETLRESFRPRLSRYLILFLLFLGENLIVTPDFGSGLAWFPVTVWFLVLALVLSLDVFLGVRATSLLFVGVVGFNLFSAYRSIEIETIGPILEKIHPWAQGSTEPLHYLPDALLGLLFGRWAVGQERREFESKFILLLVSGCMVASASLIFCKSMFKLDPSQLFATDELLYTLPSGQVFIYAMIVSTLALIHRFKEKQVPNALGLLSSISVHSLGIFLVHRIVFIKIIAPLRFHIGSWLGLPMTNTSVELLIYFGTMLLLYRAVWESGVFSKERIQA
jgi:hypothetical protein